MSATPAWDDHTVGHIRPFTTVMGVGDHLQQAYNIKSCLGQLSLLPNGTDNEYSIHLLSVATIKAVGYINTI